MDLESYIGSKKPRSPGFHLGWLLDPLPEGPGPSPRIPIGPGGPGGPSSGGFSRRYRAMVLEITISMSTLPEDYESAIVLSEGGGVREGEVLRLLANLVDLSTGESDSVRGEVGLNNIGVTPVDIGS